MKEKGREKGIVFSLTLNLVLLIILLASIVLAVCVGKYPISPGESFKVIISQILNKDYGFDQMMINVVMRLRLPRILAAVLVGAALSISGATYQGIFKNPLVSPDFLGVSNGACIGAAIAILMSLSSAYIQGFAFVGGLIAVFLTLSIPAAMRSNSNIMLVLSGIIVGGVMSSILGFIKYVADPDSELAAITYWMMGSFTYVGMDSILSVLPAILIPTIILVLMSWWIDVLSLGEAEAKTLGANVKKVRYISIICSTLLTASSVCVAGTIGWIGLVIPHFGRLIVGPDNTKLLPTAGLIGGIFLLLVDTLTRTLSVSEMPVSILTGIIGAPFYAWLLYRQRKTLT